MTGENINLLTDREWRTIHNALSTLQSQLGSYHTAQTDWAIAERQRLQQLMDKVRDNYIAPTNETQN